MKQDIFVKNNRTLKAKCDSYLVIIIGLTLIVFGQQYIMCKKIDEQKTVIVPPEIKQSVWVSNTAVSKTYLEEMAIFILHLMLDKSSINQRTNHLMLLNYVAPYAQQVLAKQLQTDEERYKKEGITTNFYPSEFVTNTKAGLVVASGKFEVRVGTKVIENKNKEFFVKFAFVQGKWRVVQFAEKVKEQE